MELTRICASIASNTESISGSRLWSANIEDELIDLNNRTVARLKFLHETRTHSQMLEFSIGDRVSFQPEGHTVLTAH